MRYDGDMSVTHVRFTRSSTEHTVRRSVLLCKENGESREYWLEVPLEKADWLVEHEDPLLVLALFPIMRCEGECHIHAEIDRRLLENLTEHMRIWKLWCPGVYHCPRLVTDAIVDRSCSGRQDEAICAFSGGVDASYALMSHHDRHWEELSLRVPAAVMIHGADISLGQQAAFDTAFSRSHTALSQLGIELIPVRMNYREYPCTWNDCHLSAIAAALALFGRRFNRGILGSDDAATKEMITLSIPYGMNYITDHLLNSSAFTITPVGSDALRTERCAFISRFPEIMQQLRVCYQANSGGYNCGVCEKCLRTALNFMAAGYNGALPYKRPFSLESLRKLNSRDFFAATNLREALDYDAHISHALPDDVRRLLQEKVSKAFRSRKASAPPSPFTLRMRCLRYRLQARMAKGKKKAKYADKLETALGQLRALKK